MTSSSTYLNIHLWKNLVVSVVNCYYFHIFFLIFVINETKVFFNFFNIEEDSPDDGWANAENAEDTDDNSNNTSGSNFSNFYVFCPFHAISGFLFFLCMASYPIRIFISNNLRQSSLFLSSSSGSLFICGLFNSSSSGSLSLCSSSSSGFLFLFSMSRISFSLLFRPSSFWSFFFLFGGSGFFSSIFSFKRFSSSNFLIFDSSLMSQLFLFCCLFIPGFIGRSGHAKLCFSLSDPCDEGSENKFVHLYFNFNNN